MRSYSSRFNEVIREDNWLLYWITKTVNDVGRFMKRGVEANANMIAFIADLFVLAVGMGLKNPMIRLHFSGKRFKVYLSARGSLCFKTGNLRPGTHDPEGDEEYMGCLYDGRFLPNRERPVQPVEQQFLDRLSADPVGFMAQCSKDMGRCCYCNQPLEDARSKQVGYGKVCAERWGLPWGTTYDEKVPSFAQLWARSNPEDQRNVRAICLAIRRNPKDAQLWGIFGDILEEMGYVGKKPVMPKGNVKMPAA